GIGVASGPVTVGIIGGKGRLEYAAVGSAVNLASRLCEQAGDGEILVAEGTVAGLDAGSTRFERRLPLALKGFPEPVANVALGTATAGGAATA
ncbi:MAG: adenylate/guanylate cyclase domain-containing protein, partial [Gammaproteobacteria bacterium]